MNNFKYKIMRLHVTPNELMIDLYNEIYKTNIELKLCRSGRISRFKALTNRLNYLQLMNQEIEIGDIIKDIECISFGIACQESEEK